MPIKTAIHSFGTRMSVKGPNKKLVRPKLKWELLILTTFTVTFYWAYYYYLNSIGGNFRIRTTTSTTPVTVTVTSRPFKILFWTTWYGFAADTSGEFVKPECSPEFQITSNRSEYDDADLILFQYVDLHR